MKNTGIILAAVMLFAGSVTLSAQSSMTDNQVIEFVQQQQARGVSKEDIATDLMRRGVTTEQMQRIRRRVENMQSEGTEGNGQQMSDSRLRVANGEKRRTKQQVSTYRQEALGDQDVTLDERRARLTRQMDFLPDDSTTTTLRSTMRTTRRTRRIFGHDYFDNPNLTFESSMNIATPQNYTLGPGDQVIIDISGASQRTISQVISPDGTITVEDYGVIRLGGMSVSAAKSHLRSVLGNRYQSSRIDLSLGQSRTITVSVVGEVKMPGTYTLSAFATVYNVLYMAGGPNDIGTLRSVKVYRKGKLLSTVDVYDFVLNGKLTGDVRLQDNDIVTVGPYEALVNISGKVKRPMFYEMKAGESLGTLVKYAGNFTGDAYQKAVRVHRKAGQGYSVFNVGEFDMASFKLMDADSVRVDSTLSRYQNMVEVRGAVFRPGMYQIGGDITTVKSLIQAAAGLTEKAIATHGVMHRMKVDRSLLVQSIDLKGILEGTVPDVALQNEDVLYIASTEDVENEKTVSILGEVIYPGTYRYAENETLEDLVLQAGGPTDAASLVKVDVARRVSDPNGTLASDTIAQNFTFSLKQGFVISGEQGFVLRPYDQVYVRKNPTYNTQQTVMVEGEVQYEGTYTLMRKNQRLSEVIRQAGGLTSQAYPRGARLVRTLTPEELAQAVEMQRAAERNSGKDSINPQKLMVAREYPVGIELDKALAHPGTDYDPVVRMGDRIVVPQYTNTVTINGEVLYPNTVSYKKGENAKYYIKLAGGYTSTSKKNKTFIVYANGMVAKADSKHKPEPGCQIVVPTKKASRGMTLPEILAIGTSTASLATMVATIANLIK